MFEDFEGRPFSSPKHSSTRTKKGAPPLYFYTVCFYLLSRTGDANFTPYTYSLHNVSLSLHLPPAHRSHIHLTTSCCSFSILPCTLMSIWGPPHLPYPLPRTCTPAAVSAPWFATRRRQRPHLLRGALFHFNIPPKEGQKSSAPP